MAHDAFVSYCSQHQATADACVAGLEKAGRSCWISHRDIVPGTDYGEAIIDAINEARSLVLIFSEESNDSPHVLREVERAVNRRIPVITFRVSNLAPRKALEYFISSPHWLDAWSEPLSPHIGRLERTLDQLLGATAGSVPPPAPRAADPARRQGGGSGGHRKVAKAKTSPKVWWAAVAGLAVLAIVGAVLLFGSGRDGDSSSRSLANAHAIGDVVPDYALRKPGGRTFCLSGLTAELDDVLKVVQSYARAAGTHSPVLATRLVAVPGLTDQEGYRDDPAVHRFVSRVGRRFALLPHADDVRNMESLGDVASWILDHSSDPIVLMPWSSYCDLCRLIEPELTTLLRESGVRFIALGGQYGNSLDDLVAIESRAKLDYLLVDDSDHRICDAFGLDATCNFVVLSADRELSYRGLLSAQELGGLLPGEEGDGRWLAHAIEAVRRGDLVYEPAAVERDEFG